MGKKRAWYMGNGFPIVTGSPGKSSWNVAVTVVSEGP
jgi:hypothetical protein